MNRLIAIVATSLLAIISFPQAAKAQVPQRYPDTFELTCPSGFVPVNTPDAVSFNPSTNLWRAYICTDTFGNLTFNGNATIIPPPGAPGGPGPSGSTVGGNCQAPLVIP